MLANSVKLSVLFVLVLICSSPALGQTHSGAGIGPGNLAPGTEPARILSKPEPQLPKDALGSSAFTIVLRAIFTSNGQVTDVRFMKVIPKDTPKETVKIFKRHAIDAAKQIKFVPAMKDGRQVSMFVQLEYNFNLY